MAQSGVEMIFIYNSLTQKKEQLQPIEPGKIKLYVCGNTVYDHCHIGHARTMVAFDSFVRYLRSEGYEVTYVHNITDIDDKIIKRANDNNESIDDLTSRFITAMHADEVSLMCEPPTLEPKATEHMDQIIDLIQVLVDKGYAYTTDSGDVNYSVHAFKDYGKLSNRDLEKLRSGARVDVDASKADALDFVLWKKAKPDEPYWDSPWGPGRPGWHIECSAMSSHILGQPFDIHGGGVDLKFPHHENEIAQSEGACGKTLANMWMHVGHLQVNDVKMSKSLGNFFTIREVLNKHPAEIIRYFLLSSHYRSPVSYSEENLLHAKEALERVYLAMRDLPDPDDDISEVGSEFKIKFQASLNDDFNTPEGFAVLFEMVRETNKLRDQHDLQAAANLMAVVRDLATPFAILQSDPMEFLSGHMTTEEEEQINALVLARDAARANKDWAEADRIRDELAHLNIVLEDNDGTTSWRRKL